MTRRSCLSFAYNAPALPRSVHWSARGKAKKRFAGTPHRAG